MWNWVRAAVHWRLGQMVHGTFQMFPQDKCWTCLTNEPCQYFIFVKYQEIPTAVENVKTCLIKGFQLCVVRQFLVCRLLIREMARAGEWAECSVTRVCLHGTSRTAPVIVLDPFAVTFSWSTFNTFRGRLIVLAVAVDTYKCIVGVLSKVHCNLCTYLHLFDCFDSIDPQTDSFTAMV